MAKALWRDAILAVEKGVRATRTPLRAVLVSALDCFSDKLLYVVVVVAHDEATL